MALKALILRGPRLDIRKVSVDLPYTEDQRKLSVYLTRKFLKALNLRTIAGESQE